MEKTHNNSTYIARHGSTPWNEDGRIQGGKNDISISQIGTAQMHRLGEYLQHIKKIKDVVAIISPMNRSKESFAIINEYLNIPDSDIHIITEMQEMNFGEFEGLLEKDIQDHTFFLKRKINKYKTPYPKGESYEDIYKRLLLSSVLEIHTQAREKAKNILVVGHQSINRILPLIFTPETQDKKNAVNNKQKNNELIIFDDQNHRTIETF